MKARFDGPEYRSGWFAPSQFAPESLAQSVIVDSNMVKLMHDLNVDEHLKPNGTISRWREEGTVTQLVYSGDMHMNRENGLIHDFGPKENVDQTIFKDSNTVTITVEVLFDIDQSDETVTWLSNPMFAVLTEVKDLNGHKTDIDELLSPVAVNTLCDTLIACNDLHQ
jgi:hypothetical protein